MVEQYLKRIGITDEVSPRIEDLVKIHQCHVLNVPFEDLDIQNRIPLKLDRNSLFEKVVRNRRGGFCYELNHLFYLLLSDIGFRVRMVSARIFNKPNILGPRFDHMALIVSLDDTEWLADVGFGELFIQPLKVSHPDFQEDLFHHFKITPLDGSEYRLSMLKGGKILDHKYIFETAGQTVDRFKGQCEIKQTNDHSYFVKNKICTLPNPHGRKTIFNNRFITKHNGASTHVQIRDKDHESELLAQHFNIIGASKVSPAPELP